MENISDQPIIFISHGGGPLPLYSPDAITHLLSNLANSKEPPRAILVISAHWETQVPTIIDNPDANLLFDYYGFPQETYQYSYPAPSASKDALSLLDSLGAVFPESKIERQRGWDHGVFVPLMLMYPKANIPVFQLSLLSSLNAERHLELGEQLQNLSNQGILIIGSGFSFHNMQVFMNESNDQDDRQSEAFDSWLNDVITNPHLSESERKLRMIEWERAPYARYCHPREEHLLPLHVCLAAANYKPAENIFNEKVFGIVSSGFKWSN